MRVRRRIPLQMNYFWTMPTLCSTSPGLVFLTAVNTSSVVLGPEEEKQFPLEILHFIEAIHR